MQIVEFFMTKVHLITEQQTLWKELWFEFYSNLQAAEFIQSFQSGLIPWKIQKNTQGCNQTAKKWTNMKKLSLSDKIMKF